MNRPHITQTELEVITDRAAIGNGGNMWGGHQTRIVRTRQGVFTAYTVDTGDDAQKTWRLVRRGFRGRWKVLAEGSAGLQPVNLLAAPDGRLHVLAWPAGQGILWSGKPRWGKLDMQKRTIEGGVQGIAPYAGAGIDPLGNLCAVSSDSDPPCTMRMSYLDASAGRWITRKIVLDQMHCYSYVFVNNRQGLSLVSTRDVPWEVLGYQKPSGAVAYVFNAIGYWRSQTDATSPLEKRAYLSEEPTPSFPDVRLNGQMDAYLDTQDRMHLLYWLRGPSTNGVQQSRHRVISARGHILADVELPQEAGEFCRLFQDTRHNFYLIGSAGRVYPAGQDGVSLKHPTKLDLGGYAVEYSGYGISAPRTGTPLSNQIDIVFPSQQGRKWIYFRIKTAA